MKPKENYTTPAGVSNPRDRCQTPAYALDPLLPYLRSEWTVWECAAGEGLLASALSEHGFIVRASDLLTGQDFFSFALDVDEYEVIITNPPFSLKYHWLSRCYELGKPFALLMPVEVLGAKTAQRLFAQHGVEVILMDKRVDFKMPNMGYDGHGAQFPSAWFTWGLSIGRQLTFTHLHKSRQPVGGQLALFAAPTGDSL